MAYALEAMAEHHRKAVVDIFDYYVENSFAAYPEAPMGSAVFDLPRTLEKDWVRPC